MTMTSLGLVVAAVTNTPVPLAVSDVPVQVLRFAQKPGATAIVYIGSPTMNTTTGVGVYAAILPAAATGPTDQIVFFEGGDEIDLEQFAIASVTVGQGCFVSYQTR